MISPTLTFKIQNLYCAYAPDFDVCSFGGCFEEAVNGLHAELQTRQVSQRSKIIKQQKTANG
jgi:hypothetical protein